MFKNTTDISLSKFKQCTSLSFNVETAGASVYRGWADGIIFPHKLATLVRGAEIHNLKQQDRFPNC